MDKNKYILFSNNVRGAGFGNQLRAFVGAYIWSKVLDRELITDNYWLINCFNLPIKTQYNKDLTKKLCLHDKGFLFDDLDFNDFSEDILVFGGGYESSLSIFNNPNYKEKLSEIMINKNYYNFLKEILSYLLSNVKDIIKKDLGYEYNTLQFRSFYDVGFKNSKWLNDFLSTFKEKYDKKIPVFVTTDNEKITNNIINFLKNENFKPFSSGLKFSHTNHNKSLNPIIDWYMMGQSKEIFTTGTSFALTSSLIFSTPVWVYNKEKNINHLIDENNFTSL